MAEVTKYYTVYDRKQDEIITHGSAEECAKAMGIKQQSFYCLVTRAKQRPRGKYEVVIDEGDGDG